MAERMTCRKMPLARYLKRNKALYLMLLPLIVLLLIFNYYPMLGLQMAFKDMEYGSTMWRWHWATTDGSLDLFKHFKYLMGDKEFFLKFLNTLRISCLKLLCGFPVPILITVLLNEMTSKKIKKGVQIISYLPYFISWVIISGILISMTASGTGFQNFCKAIFGKELYFFSDDKLFIVMVVLSDIWKNCGWGTIIYLAAVNGISPELYEAATIDGANRFQRIWFITLPGILPAISINLILSLSGLVYGGFDQIFNMYNKGVYGMGDILETWIFRQGVTGGKYDVSTAMGLFNSSISLVLVLIANFVTKKLGGTAIW